MNPIIKPAFVLMNYLNYRRKLMLFCSIFAIPLAIFAIQLADSFHQQANQALTTRNSLSYIQKASELLQEMEQLRDLNVIISWQATPLFSQKHYMQKGKVISQAKHLITLTHNENNIHFLQALLDTIQNEDMVKGTESASIDAVYENAQMLLDEAYNWRRKLSYRFISKSRNNNHILSAINLVNEIDSYTKVLGEARSYGSLYLAQQFIDSHGVNVLEKTYQALSQLINSIDLKDTEYQSFFNAYPKVKLTTIKQSLADSREHLYQQLILAPKPINDPTNFFDTVSKDFQLIYQYNNTLFELSSQIAEHEYNKNTQQLYMFYLITFFISLLLLYLFIGLYHSVSINIRTLLHAAASFSAGKYDKAVSVETHDELATVADAMNNMRINIKERELKLAKMCQTDGLTQLSSRKFFDNALQISLANSRRNQTPLTIVMMDIDFFKKVNDNYGHLAGDDCLISVAKLMKSQFKRQTDIVARYGGEEFIAILYGQNLEEAVKQTEKLRATIEQTTMISGESSFHITASFGIVGLIPPEEADPQSLLALVDALLYESKDNGRNCISAKLYSQLDT